MKCTSHNKSLPLSQGSALNATDFGHIASECPNRRVVALVEEYEAEEEENVEEAIESDHEDKDELTMPDHGT